MHDKPSLSPRAVRAGESAAKYLYDRGTPIPPHADEGLRTIRMLREAVIAASHSALGTVRDRAQHLKQSHDEAAARAYTVGVANALAPIMEALLQACQHTVQSEAAPTPASIEVAEHLRVTALAREEAERRVQAFVAAADALLSARGLKWLGSGLPSPTNSTATIWKAGSTTPQQHILYDTKVQDAVRVDGHPVTLYFRGGLYPTCYVSHHGHDCLNAEELEALFARLDGGAA